MSALVKALRRWGNTSERDSLPLSFDDYAKFFNFNGLSYPFMPGTTLAQDRELPPSDFPGYAQQLLKSNGIVFACMATRQRIFSQARFQFQRMNGGAPGELFGSPLLAPLEHPWGPSSTTSDLLARMVQDADLAGNAFFARLPGGRLSHLRPDWVIIVAGSKLSADHNPNWQIDAECIGYIYMPGGPGGDEPMFLQPENVAHFAPHPDPTARFRGMSWLTPVIREVMGDSAAMLHKLMFFENGASPNIVVSLDKDITPESFMKFVELFESENAGVAQAYKTLFFGGGASIEVIGANLQQLDFKVTQGHGETRIAAAAGVPPIVVGLSEGLEASTYSNYSQARRAFADGTLTHLWQNAAGSLETLIDIKSLRDGGSNARLWYDAQHIPFLKADVKEDAEVQQVKATTVNTLITAGFEPDAALKAVEAADLSQLAGHHTGLVSVQLMKPGEKADATGKPPALPPGKPSGNGGDPVAKEKP